MPGDRRASVIEHDLLAWPALHVRMALMDDRAGPSLAAAQNRRGLVLYVAARPVDRAPRGLGRTPGRLPGRRPGRDRRPPRDPRGRRLLRLRRGPALGRRRRAPPWRARHDAARACRVSATLSPPRDDDAVATELAAPVRPAIRAATGATILPVAVARAIAFVALAAWGALHWMSMLEPAEPGRGWTRDRRRRARGRSRCSAPGGSRAARATLAAVAAIVPLTALMLLAGRIADELLLPGGWSELAGGISRGISDLPGVRVPYRGLDDWVRTVIPLGGSALVAARGAAGVLAARGPSSASRCARAAGADRALRRPGRRARLHGSSSSAARCSRC